MIFLFIEFWAHKWKYSINFWYVFHYELLQSLCLKSFSIQNFSIPMNYFVYFPYTTLSKYNPSKANAHFRLNINAHPENVSSLWIIP